VRVPTGRLDQSIGQPRGTVVSPSVDRHADAEICITRARTSDVPRFSDRVVAMAGI